MTFTNVTKVAWIRKEGQPIGQPGFGYFNCPCGSTIEAGEYNHPGMSTCSKCGRVFDGRGFILNAHLFDKMV